MIITNYNEMTLEELEVINRAFGYEYVIEDGGITEVKREV